MPGSDFAKNGRISRKLARIGSSMPIKSRRIAFQSGVIGGSSASVVAISPFTVMCVWLTDCEFVRSSTEKCANPDAKTAPNRGSGPCFALCAGCRLCGRLADRNLQGADAIDPAFDLVAGRQRRDACRRSRHDNIAGADFDLLRKLPDDLRHAPDQFGEVAFCRSVPLTESQILPLVGWPIFEAGCSAEQGAE